ncbi:unnamed protein product [Alopecurus aequalis]
MAPPTAAAEGTRKRGAGDDGDPFSLPQLQAKRGRCGGEPSVLEELGVSLESVETLHLIFPYEDSELLRGYLESSGNVLDAAIRSFRDYLASGSESTSAGTSSSSAGTSDGPELNTPTNGAEWAELIVKEISSSSDLIDAKNRAFRIIELLNKSTASCNTPDEEQKMREEHKILKQMLGGLLHQNGILKRAFLIQHNRLNEYQEMAQERAQFKEIVDKYQQQIQMLEMDLKLARQSNSMPGPYNPNVF